MTEVSRTALAAMAFGVGLAACATTAQVADQQIDGREGLTPGLYDAGEAAWNVELVHAVAPPDGFSDPGALWSPERERAIYRAMEAGEETERPPSPISFANSDAAFTGDKVIMGNFHGFNIYQTSSDAAPELVVSVVCPGGQGDVTVHGDLLFHSVEQNRARLDCGAGGVEGESSADRFLGVRIFDISDINNPRQVAAVQTCRGSHTHTLVPHPDDANVVYIYNQGTSGVRPESELEGCVGGQPYENENTALYSIDIIKVELDAPENAKIVNRPRIFADRETGIVDGLWLGGAVSEDAQRTAPTNHCHDITVYPHFNLAAGACSGNGILLDISDPADPKRIDEVFDQNMAYWHSATFNNDASKILFTDEWGGGLGARCTSEEPDNWGANIIIDVTEDGLARRSYFKIPGNQTKAENCVAHNGNLIPVPGRDIMVQGWYSGGLSVVDFTDSANPVEIGYFDRGPLDPEELFLGGYWAAYWHNGLIYGTEIVRGLDVLKLSPSDYLSENEIAAAELITFDEANTQTQEHFVWPDEPVVARAYLDQLKRSQAMSRSMASQVDRAIDRWEADRLDAEDASAVINALNDAAGSAGGHDAKRMKALAGVLERGAQG